ncbi:hypothetical protein BAY1663_02311 [Pseudomonas sp. BAY1663]|uniref:hypothetical protein n=1 Tax=Pseudomonas sp. BAY1663 TaxID=1439940 RepID=UPI00042E0DA1|nr:hypothetical protein [Pseudomonas sp. BAY1663]EXF45232.1 hypothetical protein BAY1663_02311 [Pseudomonas sp. BAY1663]
MQLTRQEDLLLDRMAAHMVASGNMDINAAIEAIRAQDQSLLTKLIGLKERRESVAVDDYEYDGEYALADLRDSMARKVYKTLRKRPYKAPAIIDGARLTRLSGGHGPDKSIWYRIDGEDAYVSLNDLQLHIAGECKADCPRCALDAQTA